MTVFDYSILRCPVTGELLHPAGIGEIMQISARYQSDAISIEKITEGFINKSNTWFYPVFDDIILLLPVYGLYIGSGYDSRSKMAFDKERVFQYYNQISYDTKSGLRIYNDSAKWVDFREVAHDYIRHSFTRAAGHLAPKGKYLLDIASGPIGLKEYVDLSENFDIRICADISVNALIQAKHNYNHRNGIYICADITNIPLGDSVCDSVLCQHTLYHIPRDEQKTAVEEMYRVAKPGSPVVIVYSLFYHSWFMNLTLLPVQLYRIARHLAGKAYVRISGTKPRLYFYPHPLSWFKRSFSFSNKMSFYCWRSTNKYFLNLFIHKRLWGRRILSCLRRSEDRNSGFWAGIGEYPMIVIKK
jgi:hypothetical protein